MLKVQVVSDNHVRVKIKLHPDADVLVIAGDFCDGYDEFFEDLIKLKNQIPLVYTPGNHEFYLHGKLARSNSIKKDSFDTLYSFLEQIDVPHLKIGKTIVINGYTFVGGVLFSDFEMCPEYTMEEKFNYAQNAISDFRCVMYRGKLVTPRDYKDMNREYMDWIENFRWKEKTCIVTHFPPHPVCVNAKYAREPWKMVNPYFVNGNIDVKGFDTWISGHVHDAIDTVVDGCRIVVNPGGYQSEWGVNGYSDCKLIELN